jgi:GNAT superfamily N-acetyltransferase
VEQVGDPEGAGNPGGGEVADGHPDAVAARLGPELGHHVRRQVDPVDPDPAAAERDGDPVVEVVRRHGRSMPGTRGLPPSNCLALAVAPVETPAMASDRPLIRPLSVGDAPACSAVIASLPYHFGNEHGRRECAEVVRASAGLVAVEGDRVVGFLTVAHHFPETSEITWMAVHADRRGRGIGRALIQRLTGDLRGQGRRLLLVLTVSELQEEPGIDDGYNRTRAFYRSVGFIPARELPDLWPNDKALLLAMPLG